MPPTPQRGCAPRCVRSSAALAATRPDAEPGYHPVATSRPPIVRDRGDAARAPGAARRRLLPAERWALACPALPTCGLALTEAERVSGDIVGAITGAPQALGARKRTAQHPHHRLPERLRPALYRRYRHRRPDARAITRCMSAAISRERDRTRRSPNASTLPASPTRSTRFLRCLRRRAATAKALAISAIASASTPWSRLSKVCAAKPPDQISRLVRPGFSGSNGDTASPTPDRPPHPDSG